MNKNVLYAIERGLKYENGQVMGERGWGLRPQLATRGYYKYCIPKVGGGQYAVLAHKLIYYFETGDERAFDPEYEVHHVDGDRSNNKFENLRLMERFAHRSMENQNNKNGAKLEAFQVEEIRYRYANEVISQTQLGLEFGVAKNTISNIVRGKSWV